MQRLRSPACEVHRWTLPELNPDEGVWDYAKYSKMPNFAPRDATHLRRRIRYELGRLKHRPDLLASFIRHSELPLAM